MKFKHVVQTRFNLATPGRDASFRNRPDWLDGRFDLFERYCLPTMAMQDRQDFDWIVYLDDATPDAYRQRIARAQQVRPFHAYYTPVFPADGWARSVQEVIGDDRRDGLLSTNLDNDDGLAADYVSRLQDAAVRHWDGTAKVLNFLNGFVMTGTRLYAHDHPHNAFVNVLEPYGPGLRTAPSIHHMKIPKELPIVQVEGPGAWLQVVHGGNVSNKVRGRLIGRAEAERRFPPVTIAELRDPSTPEQLVETLIAGPARDARDLLLKAVRAIRS